MRVLFWALSLGAIVASAEGSAASPFDPGVFEQSSAQTFSLVSDETRDYREVPDTPISGWISAALFSPPHYEALSTMAGFHDTQAHGHEQRTSEWREPPLDWDALHSPAALKGFVLPELRYFLDDEDNSVLDVTHTGSPAPLAAPAEPDKLTRALDGYEDR
jgi:hypothetical protein